MKRILTILKTVVAQVDVLETMTPLAVRSFRGRLERASGFQSAQFRELEAVLGRRDQAGAARRASASRGPRAAATILRRFLRGRDPYERSWRATGAPPAEPPAEVQDGLVEVYRSDPGEPRSASGWSTSTRASRSGATGT